MYNSKLSFSLYAGIFEPGDAFDDPATPSDDYNDTAKEIFIEADFKF